MVEEADQGMGRSAEMVEEEVEWMEIGVEMVVREVVEEEVEDSEEVEIEEKVRDSEDLKQLEVGMLEEELEVEPEVGAQTRTKVMEVAKDDS
eukprot:SM000051S17619  [mRNA]  locus=s51:612166:612441:+ [translate_table: standard]